MTLTSLLLSPVLTLTPLVHKDRRWFRVGWLDPWREKSPLVCLIPQVLVQVGICDFLQRLYVVYRNQVTVQVHELNPDL